VSAATRECAKFDQLLSAYVDHEASPDEVRLVEQHLADCQACLSRTRRLERRARGLDLRLQGLLARGEAQARRLNPSFRPPPGLLLADAPSTSGFGRLLTLAVVLAVVALMAVVLVRSAPVGQPLQTGAPPTPSTALTAIPDGPVVWISIDGLVDPPTAAFVQRAVAEADRRHAALLVVSLSPTAGLDGPTAEVARTLSNAPLQTVAYLPSAAPSATATALAASTASVMQAPPVGDTLQMDFVEALWHRLLDPTTAYLFLVLGLYAILVEIAHPGALLPGVSGAVALAIAAIAFSTLPTNWLGVLALVLGVGLMGLELHSGAAHHGLLLLAGAVFLGVGSLVLFAPASVGVVVSPFALVPVVLGGLGLGFAIVRIARRVRRLPPLTGLGELIGARGVARTALNPDGVVNVRGQLWSAHSRGPTLAPGEAVRVLARRGLVLDVESAAFRAPATQKGAHRD
jgi:membrane-bound ClpP family serine protease